MPIKYTIPDFIPQEVDQLVKDFGNPESPTIPAQPTPDQVLDAMSPTALGQKLVEVHAVPTEEEHSEPTKLSGAEQALIVHEMSWLKRFVDDNVNTLDPEGVAQTAVLKYLQSGHEVDPQKIRAWLAATARNEATSGWRSYNTKVKPKPQEEIYDLDCRRDSPASDPLERAADIAASREVLTRIMSELTDRQRELVFDYFVHRKSISEIAEREGVSEAAIIERIGRIRRSAREVGKPILAALQSDHEVTPSNNRRA